MEGSMRLALMLLVVALAIGTFILATARPQQRAPVPVPVRRQPRRIAPELTASAAADRWYDEA